MAHLDNDIMIIFKDITQQPATVITVQQRRTDEEQQAHLGSSSREG